MERTIRAMPLAAVLERAEHFEWDSSLFLSGQSFTWTLATAAIVIPDDELNADDGHADAKAVAARYVLSMSTVQDVKSNAVAQKPGAVPAMLLDALRHYFENDAFIVFS